jgi:hypothetical protein
VTFLVVASLDFGFRVWLEYEFFCLARYYDFLGIGLVWEFCVILLPMSFVYKDAIFFKLRVSIDN